MNKKPLAGKTILITRAREQSGEFTASLQKLGAEVIEFPTIEIVPPFSWKRVDQAILRLGTYHWIIFTSANGVIFFWERLREKRRLHRPPRSLKVCAIGPATANQLEERGVPVDLVPKEFIAESVVEAFKKMGVNGKRMLLARAKKARDVLPKGLKKLGAEVNVVEVYRTIKPKGVSKKLTTLLENRKVDVIAFTSSSTVNHFAELLKKNELTKCLEGISIACIGPVTADTARQRGLRVQIQPEKYTIPGLAKAISEYFSSHYSSPPERRACRP